MLPTFHEALRQLDLDTHWFERDGSGLTVVSPIDGTRLATLRRTTPPDLAQLIGRAHDAFLQWRVVPAPQRGELVRRFGNLVREHKSALAAIITWEVGKIPQESLGEVQEVIDICDFAVGLSRQLYGKTIATERPDHRMMEQWHPLGPIGVITAFNFPMAVWAWNAAIALVCGDTLVWKPSEKTPLSAIACQQLLQTACGLASAPPGISHIAIGDATLGQALAADSRLPLISATGSVAMGRAVAQTVAARLGRTLLELGGNNGMIVTPSADLDLAVRAIVFAAVGTCGQRCTTLRRLIVHESIADALLARLTNAYESLPVGNPLDDGVLVGPLIDARAAEAMARALATAIQQGGRILTGGQRIERADPSSAPVPLIERAGPSSAPIQRIERADPSSAPVPPNGHYIRPALIEIPPHAPIVHEETFAPILYIMRYRTFDEAIAIHNAVPQGLASAIFTADIREAERFLSAAGSDCGIANVNIGTSGAEIGGAFGGEKQTGGGREAGSDAWKTYMRRVTNTINYSAQLPLAQGIRFEAS